MADGITEIDINAYIDGELDDERRLHVEDWLAHHPDAAAQVMADLHLNGVLRLAKHQSHQPSARVRDAARRLNDVLHRRRPLRGLRLPILVAATVAALIAAPVRLPLIGPDGSASAAPTYLDDAVRAHRTAQMRAQMHSMPESVSFDAGEVLLNTRIRVPKLPAGWRIRDVQLFPSAEGPALQLSIETGDGMSLSMFAIYATSGAPADPIAIRHDGETVAYWQEEQVSYAMVGNGTPEQLDRLADDLEDNDLA
ncbi:MAG: anti-sigma factor [Sphingomonadaceae bacterium]